VHAAVLLFPRETLGLFLSYGAVVAMAQAHAVAWVLIGDLEAATMLKNTFQ
jgi:hypothetical protein